MKLSDIDFPFASTQLEGGADSTVLGPLFSRVSRVFRSVREALTESEGRARVIRYNTPPTSPATAAALPTAGVTYLGTIVHLDKNGAADDTVHICIRNNAGSYVWKQVQLI